MLNLALAVLVYLGVAIGGAVWLCRGRARQLRVSRPSRYRTFLAAYLALSFTPSLIGDLWLIAVPGPALLGFLFLFLPIAVQLFAAPRDIVQYVYATLGLHVAPIIIVFGIIYGILCVLARFRARRMAQSV
jgi:hypothetical protein